MKFFIAFALLAVAHADVSHLAENYLPPVHSRGHAMSFVAPVVEDIYTGPDVHYTAPAVHQQHQHHHHVAPAPVNEYLPPGVETYTGPAIQTPYSVPSVSYAAPVVHKSYSAPAVHTTYSAPAVHQTYAAPAVHSTYSAPAVHQTYAAPHVHHSVPAVQNHYSAPDVNYLAPVPQTYSGHSVSYSGGSSGTQYASNGGYVYRKK